jgi:hypothetical protein
MLLLCCLPSKGWKHYDGAGFLVLFSCTSFLLHQGNNRLMVIYLLLSAKDQKKTEARKWKILKKQSRWILVVFSYIKPSVFAKSLNFLKYWFTFILYPENVRKFVIALVLLLRKIWCWRSSNRLISIFIASHSMLFLAAKIAFIVVIFRFFCQVLPFTY